HQGLREVDVQPGILIEDFQRPNEALLLVRRQLGYFDLAHLRGVKRRWRSQLDVFLPIRTAELRDGEQREEIRPPRPFRICLVDQIFGGIHHEDALHDRERQSAYVAAAALSAALSATLSATLSTEHVALRR